MKKIILIASILILAGCGPDYPPDGSPSRYFGELDAYYLHDNDKDKVAWCGLRKGEILKLRWGDIVNKGIFVKEYQKSLENNPPDSEAFIESAFSDFAFNIRGDTTKTGQSRFVPITSELLRELVEYYFVNVGIKSSKTFAEDMLKKAKEFKVTGDYNISDIGFDKFIVQPQHKK